MSQGTIGLFIFGGLVLVSSVVAHRFIARVLLASGVTALATAFTFQAIVFFELGYMDPFWPIALGLTLVYAFVGSLVIGYLMRLVGIAARTNGAT